MCRKVWVRAMAGEFVCTFIFFFSVVRACVRARARVRAMAGRALRSFAALPDGRPVELHEQRRWLWIRRNRSGCPLCSTDGDRRRVS
jgi:hypothetical protein